MILENRENWLRGTKNTCARVCVSVWYRYFCFNNNYLIKYETNQQYSKLLITSIYFIQETTYS